MGVEGNCEAEILVEVGVKLCSRVENQVEVEVQIQ
jgi:hypothetical protein